MTLRELIDHAQSAIAEIRKHPDYKEIAKTYSPDLTLTDASAALSYIQWELTDRQIIDIRQLESIRE